MNIEEFVKISKTCTTLDELVQKTGLGYRTVSEYLRKLRKAEIDLPKLKPRGGRNKVDLEFLKSVWNSSHTFNEVLERTGYNPTTVAIYSQRYNLDLRPLRRLKRTDDPKFRVWFISIWQKANSLDEISKLTKLNKATVTRYAQILREEGVELQRFQTPKVASEIFIEAYNNSHSCEEVAKNLNMSLNAVYVQAWRLKKKGVELAFRS